MLERYCQRFRKINNNIALTTDNFLLHQEGSVSNISISDINDANNITYFKGTKAAKFSGYKIDINYNSAHTYILSYNLKITDGNLYSIGGHNASFYTNMIITQGEKELGRTSADGYVFTEPLTANEEINITARYNFFSPTNEDNTPYIFI